MTALRGVFTRAFLRSLAAEFLGTGLFVLLSLGAAVSWPGAHKAPGVTHIALAFGLSLATAVHCFGHVSGAHLNPAVTAALLAVRRTTLAKALLYVTSQCLGAVAGAALLFAVTPEEARGSLGVTKVSDDVGAGRALLVEALVSVPLSLAVFAASDSRRRDLSSGPLAIGLSVTAGHLFAIPYTGASMNPARSLGPAVIMGSFTDHWVYWLGPTLGALLGGTAYEFLLCPDAARKRGAREPPSSFPAESDRWPPAPPPGPPEPPRPGDGRESPGPAPRSRLEPEPLVLSPTVHVIQLEREQRRRSYSEL